MKPVSTYAEVMLTLTVTHNDAILYLIALLCIFVFCSQTAGPDSECFLIDCHLSGQGAPWSSATLRLQEKTILKLIF